MEDEHRLCVTCGKIYPSNTDLGNHQCPEALHGKNAQTIAGESIKPSASAFIMSGKLKCALCDYVASRMHDLIMHTSSHAIPTSPFKCNRCAQTFSIYGDLQKHPCGDAGFVFLLNSPKHDESPDDSIQVDGLGNSPRSHFTNMLSESSELKENANKISKEDEQLKSPCDNVKFVSRPDNSTQGMDVSTLYEETVQASTMLSGLSKPKYPMNNTSKNTMNIDMNSDTTSIPDTTPDDPITTPMMLRIRQSINYDDMANNQSKDKGPNVLPGSEIQVNLSAKMGKRGKSGKSIVYSCEFCNYNSTHSGNYKVHARRHLTPGMSHSECKKCGLKFLSYKSLSCHECTDSKSGSSSGKAKIQARTKTTPSQVQSDNTNLLFQCRLCDFSSTIKANVIKHVHRHRCKSCHEVFPTTVKRNKHIAQCYKQPATTKDPHQQAKTTYGETIFFRRSVPSTLVHLKCAACTESGFKSMNHFKGHSCLSIKKRKANSSVIYSKGTTGPKQLAKGPTGKMEGYDDELMKYCCKYCLFTSTSAIALINHNKIVKHSPTEMPLAKTLVVQERRIGFVREMEMRRKKPRMEGWDEDTLMYKCATCDFVTSTPIALYNHKKFHDPPVEISKQSENPVDVPVEEDGNSEKSYVQDNQQKMVASYNCSSCDFTADKLWLLGAHEGLHTGKRPFKCSGCNIGFSNQFHLDIHHTKAHRQVENALDTESHSVSSLTEVESAVLLCCHQPRCGFVAKDNVTIDHHLGLYHRKMIRQAGKVPETESSHIPFGEVETVVLKDCPQSGSDFFTKDPAMLSHGPDRHFSSSSTIMSDKENHPKPCHSSRSEVTEIEEENCTSVSPTGHIGAENGLKNTQLQSPVNSCNSKRNTSLQHMTLRLGERLESTGQVHMAPVNEKSPDCLQIERLPVKHKLFNSVVEESSMKNPRVLSAIVNVAAHVNHRRNAIDESELYMLRDGEWEPIDQAPEGRCTPKLDQEHAFSNCSDAESKLMAPLLKNAQSQFRVDSCNSKRGASLQQMTLRLGERLEPAGQVYMAPLNEKNADCLQTERLPVKRKLSNLEAKMSSIKTQGVFSVRGNTTAAVDIRQNAIDDSELYMLSNGEWEPIDQASEGRCTPNLGPEHVLPTCSGVESKAMNYLLSPDKKGEVRRCLQQMGEIPAASAGRNQATQTPLRASLGSGGGGHTEYHSRSPWRRPGWSLSERNQPEESQFQPHSTYTSRTTMTSSAVRTQPPLPLVAAEGRENHGRTLVLNHGQNRGAAVENPMTASINSSSRSTIPVSTTRQINRPVPLVPNETATSQHRCPELGHNEQRCGFCRIQFEDFHMYLHHLRQHHPNNPLMCTYCWRDF